MDGVGYRAGDRVVALTPDHTAGLVTSQRATVTTVGPNTGTVIVRTDDDRHVTLSADQLGPDRLGHAYATTVHRFQGSTVDRAHLYADGGGRELAYVAMSRARHASTAYVVADDLDQAREDLQRDWAARRTPTWAIDTALPSPERLRSNPQAVGERERAGIVALRHARNRLLAAATHPGRPPSATQQAEEVRAALAQASQRLADLDEIGGAYRSGPIGDAARHADTAAARLAELEHTAATAGWRERRQARRELAAATAATTAAKNELGRFVAAERGRLGVRRRLGAGGGRAARSFGYQGMGRRSRVRCRSETSAPGRPRFRRDVTPRGPCAAVASCYSSG